MSEPLLDFDSPWKEALEHFFEAFISFFFPVAHAEIDWDRGYEFLDQELRQVVRDAEIGARRVDRLVKVWRRNGEEAWLLIHIEVQAQVDHDLPQRMYVYNYRIFDRYDRWVISMAILADTQPDWRPDRFGYALWGCEIGFRFPGIKLLDYMDRCEELEASDNPFAVIVLAHLQTQATRGEPHSRYAWKVRLARGLYRKNFAREDILEMFRFIDWLMVLPPDLDNDFDEQLERDEEELNMPYVTGIERRGIEKGLEQGALQEAQDALIDNLNTRFGLLAPELVQRIRAQHDKNLLRELRRIALTTASLDEFNKHFPS